MRGRQLVTASYSITRKADYANRYDELIKSNELLCVADLIKTKLQLAYSRNDEALMAEDLMDIVILCCKTNNKHFQWFANLIINHYDGIVTHEPKLSQWSSNIWAMIPVFLLLL